MTTSGKTKILISIIAVLLVVNLGMLIFFLSKHQPSTGMHEQKPRYSLTAVLEKEVGFDKQQLDQFEQMRDKHHQQIKPLFDSLRIAKDRFYVLLNQPRVSDSTLKAAARKIGERQEILDLQVFQQFRELKSLCREEQLPKFDSVLNRIVKRISFPHKKGGGGYPEDSIKDKTNSHNHP